ncbi:MAG: hypothetical protein ACM34J_03375 [Ignavibacteria bacterium]
MIRFILFLLILFIVYGVVKFFFRVLTGSGRTYDKMHQPKSKYENVEDAKYKEIDNSSEKNDKT